MDWRDRRRRQADGCASSQRACEQGRISKELVEEVRGDFNKTEKTNK
jgi:hypothetical protein